MHICDDQAMASAGRPCARRKQAIPRRRNVELEDAMPEDSDLIVRVAELASPAESLNKSKDSAKIVSDSSKLKSTGCEPIERQTSSSPSSCSPTSPSPSSKENCPQQDISAKASPEPSAKETICNTSLRNGYAKTVIDKPSHEDGNSNDHNDEMKQSMNGHATDETDTEEEDDQQKDDHISQDITDKPVPSANGSDDQNEDAKIKEYLQRSDTAVIFPEPVSNELGKKTKCQRNKEVEKKGQSAIDDYNEDDNASETDRNRMPENGSPNNGVATTMRCDLLARCPHCGKLFRGPRSTLSLQEHITNIHAPTTLQSASLPLSSSPVPTGASVTQDDLDKPYVCTKCKAAFMHKEHLEKHEQLHSSQGQSCQLCNKSFANVYRLQRHMLSHDESQVLRKFKCPECFKAFKFKHHLKEHIRIHSGEKPFACPNCGKRFSHSGSYSSHMTSKKCLVVNLKVRKTDQIRSQRNRNNHHSPMNNAFNTQTSLNSVESLVNPSVNSSNNNSRHPLPHLSKSDRLSLSNANISVLKNEGNFPGLFSLSPEFPGHIPNPDHHSLANYLSTTNFPPNLSNLSPALLSAAAASVGLSPHYLPSSLSNYPDVANTILGSQLDKIEKDIDFSKEKMPFDFNKPELFKQLNSKSIFDTTDLKSIRKILQMVDATSALKQEAQSNSLPNGSINEIRSPNPSPLTFSAASFHLPQIAPIDPPDDNKKQLSEGRCRFCGEFIENKYDLHKHENFFCKSFQAPNKSLNESIKFDSPECAKFSHPNIGESDEESQRDSFSFDEEMTDGKKVRVRSVLSEETLRVLRAQYEINPRPKKHDIQRLSEEVNYPPRVVQVWFQNMRARDRRLGRSMPTSQTQPDLHLSESGGGHRGAPGELSSSFHSISQYSIPQSLLPINIPHYKPSQFPHSYSPTTIVNSHGYNGTPLFSHKNNDQTNSVAKEFMPKFTIKNESNGHSEEPLDLSVKNKNSLTDLNHNTSSPLQHDFEVLNLSKKSSEISSDKFLTGNVSLAILQQQQRQELEQSSIVRSMLQNKCHQNDIDASSLVQFDAFPLVNGVMQSPSQRSVPSPNAKDANDVKVDLKRPHSNSEEVGHISDSTNPSDEYNNSSNSPSSRSKLSMCSTPKIWRGSDNMTVRDNQTPPEVNQQGDGSGLFTCDQCDKTFSKQSSLARHKYEHSGQRPHKCDVCSKAFKHKHHLTEHKRLHSGEKPFQCKKCLKRFSHSGSYSQHMNHRYSYCKPYRE